MKELYRGLPRAKVEALLSNPVNKRMRQSYYDHFPPAPWYLFWTATKPSDFQFNEWWQDYLDSIGEAGATAPYLSDYEYGYKEGVSNGS